MNYGPSEDGLLLVGHGSRSDEGASEMRVLGKLVAEALPDVAVDVGFLEMTDPPADRRPPARAARRRPRQE